MSRSSLVSGLLALTLFAIPATHAVADEQELENGLIGALRLKKGTTERLGDSGKAIQAYMRAGLVDKKPNRRADYTDYYLLKRPAKFMGHELVLIEEEYMSRYVGCCVSPGVGISVRANGSTRNLERFAETNKCAFVDQVDLQTELSGFRIKASLPPGNYISLSCRERDADH